MGRPVSTEPFIRLSKNPGTRPVAGFQLMCTPLVCSSERLSSASSDPIYRLITTTQDAQQGEQGTRGMQLM